MSNADTVPGSDCGQSDRDPVTGLFAAVRDAWLALATANGCGFVNPGEGAAADLPPGYHQSSIGADFLLPMGQAMMIAGNRSFSYWLNLAQILGNYQAKSIQALGAEAGGGAAGSERLVAVDDLRALLREVGELATREARFLQNEFDILAEGLAQSHQPSNHFGPYRRRWRSKV